MQYWFFVTTPENLEIIKEENVIAVARRNEKPISKTVVGDKLLVYTRRGYLDYEPKEPAVAGVFEITSNVFCDDSKVFISPPTLSKEIFPLRVKIRVTSKEIRQIAFKPLIPRLSFILNKKKWGSTLQGRVLIRLKDEDYQTIVSALKKNIK